jgi:FemAB-related protein (PEP-CTERM system-associated)
LQLKVIHNEAFMVIKEVGTPAESKVWDEYVVRHPHAYGYHLSGWRSVIESAFGHQTYYFFAEGDRGEIQGILPLVFLSSRLFNRCLVSMPFLNYGGLIADTDAAKEALLTTAISLAKQLDAVDIELRQEETFQIEWPGKHHKVSMRLDLPREYELLWKAFPSKLRSQIRRAQKEGMTVQIGGKELLPEFYSVFSRNMRDLGTPVYGRNFFDTIMRVFPNDTWIVTVMLKSQPLAAALLCGFRTMVEIPWASSDRRFNHLAPNMLLYSGALEYACRKGFTVFDFGRTTPESGTYKFKAQWGAKTVPLSWKYWMASGEELPDVSPRNPKYQLAVQLWQRLPLSVANCIGPLVVRSIP